jgi:hypothetical protein
MDGTLIGVMITSYCACREIGNIGNKANNEEQRPCCYMKVLLLKSQQPALITRQSYTGN